MLDTGGREGNMGRWIKVRVRPKRGASYITVYIKLYYRKTLKFAPSVWQLCGNGKEAVHLTTIRQTEKSELNVIIWILLDSFVFSLFFLYQFLRVLGVYWCIVYMRVSLFFLVFSFFSLEKKTFFSMLLVTETYFFDLSTSF